MQKLLRFDTFVAVCSLLISSLSCVATIFQTHVIANQLSASVWPYHSFEASFTPTGILLELNNDGLGPALIRSATLAVDGRPVGGCEADGRVLQDGIGPAKASNHEVASDVAWPRLRDPSGCDASSLITALRFEAPAERALRMVQADKHYGLLLFDTRLLLDHAQSRDDSAAGRS